MSAWSRREKLPLGGLRRLWSLADSANIFASRIVGRNEWRNSTAFIRPTQFIEYFNAKGGSSVDHPRFNKSGISSIYLPIPFPSKDSKFILLSFFFLRANLIDRLRKRNSSRLVNSLWLVTLVTSNSVTRYWVYQREKEAMDFRMDFCRLRMDRAFGSRSRRCTRRGLICGKCKRQTRRCPDEIRPP